MELPRWRSRISITEETFQQDTIDMEFLHSEIVRMTEKISFQLRDQNKLTGCITGDSGRMLEPIPGEC